MGVFRNQENMDSGTSEHWFIAELRHHPVVQLQIKSFTSAHLSTWEMRLTLASLLSLYRANAPPSVFLREQ